MSFWSMAYLTFGLLSIATVSPIPLAIVFVVWLFSRPLEAPLVAEVERTGGNADAIPNPTTGGYGCAAFIVWVLVFGSMAIVSLAFLLAIVEGKTL
jgi:hypothetical protein